MHTQKVSICWELLDFSNVFHNYLFIVVSNKEVPFAFICKVAKHVE